jgi:hypothetical protein
MFKLCLAHDMDFLCMRCAGKQGRCDGKQVKRTAYITPALNMRLRLPRTCRCSWSPPRTGCHIRLAIHTSAWLPAACQHAQHTKHRVRQPRIPDWMQTRIPAHEHSTGGQAVSQHGPCYAGTSAGDVHQRHQRHQQYQQHQQHHAVCMPDT